MARGSLKQRKNQRRSIIPPSSPSMAKTPPPASRFNCRRISISFLVLSSFVFLLIYTTTKTTLFSVSSSEIYSIEVVNEYPHDPNAFTQGLLYGGNDTFFESTGLYGESSVRQVFLQTGEVLALHQMDGSYFGEGLTMLGGRLFQVTWKEKTGFIYDRYNLSKWTMFTHQMRDGWGLATDGKVIFGSDGTSTLYRLGPKSLKVMGKVTVTYKGREVFYINELEYINGEVWANVWQTDCIARISPKDGEVLGWIVLEKLRKSLVASGNQNIDVLNGIAWDRRKNRLFVTGKKWPKLYEIKVHPVKGSSGGTIEELCLPRAVPGVPS
ncbi:glutaminyl-peptide cyclotransferase isoform X1 [Cinnamomum micranthum f. kanehirae]|uniref:Glutaminyl-peptide cyclotransferase isoform X1 n=1 Tax=Cinnamomum micranthum f. kanehirae TaxID=337451 RepID=A0A3S3NCH5_9MAGN|nr:glutaminyl-peptide cyclotransferase isoform X1 [Cinnamomum micranthum f. kanehirae]